MENPNPILDGRQVLEITDIMSILPHRYPFLLIDRLIEIERKKRIVAIKNVTINEPFFAGHFPNFPSSPASSAPNSAAR
jgi:3-hydroxyacyl-[acyl-carrier-protein] dehydratase